MKLSGFCPVFLRTVCASLRLYAEKPREIWRPLGDSNPCCRRERATGNDSNQLDNAELSGFCAEKSPPHSGGNGSNTKPRTGRAWTESGGVESSGARYVPTLARWLANGLNSLRGKGYSIFAAARNAARRGSRTVASWVCAVLFWSWAAVVAVTWFVGLFLIGWVPEAKAELSITKERNTTLLRDSVRVTLTKQAGGLIACMIPLDDVIAGEQIDLRGVVNTTNDTPDVIGVTSEMMVWENGAWANLRADAPNQADDSDLDGQNLTLEQHHRPYVSFADYSTRDYAGRVWFGVGVWAYRRPNPYGALTLHTCSIRAMRIRP